MKSNVRPREIRQSLMKRAKQTQSQSMFTSDTALGKPVLSHIYENPEDLDQTGAELDSIGPAGSVSKSVSGEVPSDSSDMQI